MAKILTATGAIVSTASPKFGTGAALFDGAGDWIDTPDHADFNFGSGDFTIDFWLKRNSVDAGNLYIGFIANSAGTEILSMKLGADKIQATWFSSEPVSYTITSTSTITDTTTWHHIAWLRDGNTIRLFIDGIAEGTVDVTGKTMGTPNSKFTFGRLGEYTLTPFNGRIDEFRVSKGIARWTANFTPPSSAYTADSYSQTGLLVHCDGTDGSTSFTDDDVIPSVGAKNGIFFGINI